MARKKIDSCIKPVDLHDGVNDVPVGLFEFGMR